MDEQLRSGVKRLSAETYDAVVDGEVVHGITSELGLVADSSELTNYEDRQPGFIAATYGLTSIWMLKPDGTWAAM